MPTVLSVTMAIGSHRLAQQGAITKRMTAIEEMAGMDVLCSDKTGTLTLNKLTVDKNMIEVFAKGVDKDMVVLMAARASRLENQDAIDCAIVSMLADPKEARAGIQEVHFLPFNPTDKRTALTYIDAAGKMHRVSKGAPEQILHLAHNKTEIEQRVHSIIDKFAERGLRSLAVARQGVPAGTKDSPGGPWEFVGLLPLFDPPRHDSAETIRRALDLGVSVKMITGDQLAIAKETGRRLGMGTNMYPSSSLLGEGKDEAVGGLPIDELIEKADGFAGVFPEHKYEIVRRLQARKHICGMTGDGVNDAPALKKADIGIAVADSTDAARGASDIVLTEPGLSVIISAVLTSRAIFQRMKNYTIYAVSITIRIVLGFMLLTVFWKFDFPPFMVLVIAILNDGTIMTISKDRVKPSPLPDSWKLSEIFATGVVLGSYLALMSVVFFWLAYETNFFPEHFNVRDFNQHHFNMTDEKIANPLKEQLASAVYLQVSTISQALIFVTRSRSWSFLERPGLLLVSAFIIAQLIATAISATATWKFAGIRSIGWGWTAIIWVYNILTYFLLDPIKFAVGYALSGRAWNSIIDQRTAFTSKNDFGKEARSAAWAAEQRTLHGLNQSAETRTFHERNTFRDINLMAEEAKRRAELARMREIHTLKGKVESFAKLRGLDIDAMNHHYTLTRKTLLQIHALILRNAIDANVNILTKFITTCGQLSSISHARHLFDNRSNRDDTFLCNSMIRSHVVMRQFASAFNLYKDLRRETCFVPDNFTFTVLAKCCALRMAVWEGLEMHGHVVKIGFCFDMYVSTTLVDMYAKFGNLGLARRVFNDMTDRSLVSWTALIGGYVRRGDIGKCVVSI
ncbi:hypothetical protein OIU84_015813 [Salix udensis]|uniref:Plasma membrane ATPase n=1 Tax=Salix udensis TaxID=889485 RepID=A0AAD6NQ19_9ROSI|nr:hypothetical protein OIU84_015813 [Salix udensis]